MYTNTEERRRGRDEGREEGEREERWERRERKGEERKRGREGERHRMCTHLYKHCMSGKRTHPLFPNQTNSKLENPQRDLSL